MPDYKTIQDLGLKGKRVLVRLDLNVPIKDGKIADYTRIDACLKTITYLVNNKAKTILMSHLGRPDGEKDPELSLKPVADSLSDKLSVKVKIAPDCIGQEVEEMVNNMKEENIILLENLRFHSGEEANDPEFVNRLARLADVYINDAFATAHRAHASTYGVPLKLFKENKDIAAGFLMDEELRTWKPILGAKGTGVAIIGGAKLKEKMKAVKELSKSFDRIIIGGVVANVFMKAAGYDISDSKYMEEDKDYTDDAKAILKKCKNIILPSEVVIATTDFKEKGKADPKQGLEKGTIAADTIPSSEDTNAIKEAAKIVWFGPLGIYEKGFKEGSLMIAGVLAETKGHAVIGGGDLAAAAKGVKAQVSTGGGASIQYITKGKLEALEALKGNRL
ncbi:MAG: phosphoglycerate kinase [Nanoarchaeota archaeon]|nr:phosphoglycerate kinase [Nanoarchaeota archaeon]